MNVSIFLRTSLSFRALLLAASHIRPIQAKVEFSSTDTCDSRNSPDSCGRMSANEGENWKHAKSIYEFHATDIDGNDVSMEKYRGKVLIIVNVACKCGFTNDHYTELVALHDKYRDQGLSILGFPCNQFMGQEPGSEAEIKDFIAQYNVGFDMFAKVDVNGAKTHPLWKYLKDKQGGTLLDAIKWNFTKFIVDRHGQPVARHSPQTKPKEMEKELEKYLNTAA
ncbi:uncharacterized protein LOC129588880 [Paramacrobiotus metropolitanus]|uniref:uncharacterized protein LOC129588880 n=1 Tax=Paramacrobiotus metropolitanus TaxID=2943436 RepID=UPI0024461327|nr:uncharacterized protein LOC129588880 [Paramacrobiotus metropolitanus]